MIGRIFAFLLFIPLLMLILGMHFFDPDNYNSLNHNLNMFFEDWAKLVAG